jgi:hypothetical protein
MTTAVESDGKIRRLAGEARAARVAAERAEQAWLVEEAAQRQAQLLDPHPENCPSLELAAAWEPIAAKLREVFSENDDLSTWRVWIEPVHPHRLESGVWVLATFPRQLRWTSSRFQRVFEFAAERPVRFVGCDQPNQRRAP